MDLNLEGQPNRRGRHIQVFIDGCKDCIAHLSNVEVGKCAGCILEVHQMDKKTELTGSRLRKYKVTTHPTTIIDEEIKIEGTPDFYWLCGDDFYEMLKRKYPLTSTR